jgi:hypothetical protein
MRAELRRVPGRKRRVRRASVCAGCGGPHPFDTSVPSPLWNRVVRPRLARRGCPEFLCLTCITAEFVRAGVSFSARLWGTYRGRWLRGQVVEVRIGGRASTAYAKVQEENNRLRAALIACYETAERAMRAATRPVTRPLSARQSTSTSRD